MQRRAFCFFARSISTAFSLRRHAIALGSKPLCPLRSAALRALIPGAKALIGKTPPFGARMIEPVSGQMAAISVLIANLAKQVQ
jgi:hypothetical protein